jgi:hypothetical protein
MQHHQINQVRVARARLRRQQPNDFGGDNVMAQVLIQVFHALLLKREFFRAVHPLSVSSMRAFANDEMASINGVGPAGGIPCALFQLFLLILLDMPKNQSW